MLTMLLKLHSSLNIESKKISEYFIQSPILHHLCIKTKVLENVIIEDLLILRVKLLLLHHSYTVFFIELNLRLLDSVQLTEYFYIIDKH